MMRFHPRVHTARRPSAVLLGFGASLAAVAVSLSSAAPVVALPVEVVTTLSTYGSIAREIGGNRVEVQSISRSDEDAHFVKPKPSYALMLKRADLFVTTGLDLELWAPVLLDKAGNRKIRSGEPGYVSASEGIALEDVPASADRSAGDVHVYGNPHVITSPINVKIVARNIAAGLSRVDPEGAETYRANLAAFERRIDEALYGRELVELLGAEVLDPLAEQGKLIEFLEQRQYLGAPLIGRLGGWLARLHRFDRPKIIAYHNNWVYLTELFGLDVIGFVEAKPGIPPSARHVKELIDRVEDEGVGVLLAASYYSSTQVDTIAERTGCRAVRVSMGPSAEGSETYVDWMGSLIDRLAEALAASAS
jgi:ABC-type Zn uptake system ZnuABC Zn-binding protein ZnuA